MVCGFVPRIGVTNPSVGVAGGTLQRGVGVATGIDRHWRWWMRLERERRDVVVLAVPLDPSALPQFAQRRDHLVEPLAAVREVLALQVELFLHPPGTGTKRDATV